MRNNVGFPWQRRAEELPALRSPRWLTSSTLHPSKNRDGIVLFPFTIIKLKRLPSASWITHQPINLLCPTSPAGVPQKSPSPKLRTQETFTLPMIFWLPQNLTITNALSWTTALASRCGHSPTTLYLPDPELVPTKQVFWEQSLIEIYLYKKKEVRCNHMGSWSPFLSLM